MSDYVPTIDEVRDSLVYLNKHHAKQYGDVDLLVVGSETAAQFDRMIAEVERAAAARALEGAAEHLSDGLRYEFIIEISSWEAVTVCAGILRARAAEIREGKSE